MDRNKHYLSHADKGDEREDHKYVARVETGNPKNPYRYFYTLPEYNKYLKSAEAKKDKARLAEKKTENSKKFINKKEHTKTSKKPGTLLSKLVNKGKNVVDKSVSSSSKNQNGNTSKDVVNKGVKAVSNILNKTTKQVDKIVDKVSKDTKTVIQSVDKKINSTVNKIEKQLKTVNKESTISKGKEAVDKLLAKNGNKTVQESESILNVPGSFIHKIVSTAINGLSNIVDKIIGIFKKKPDTKPNDNANDKDKDDKQKPIDHPVADKDPSNLTVTLKNGTKMKFESKDEYNDYLERCDYQAYEPDFMKDIPDIPIDTAYTKFADQEKVNEEYDPFDPKTSTNCANCSAAYELRRRGYDVEAVTNGGEESYNGMLSRVYDYFEGAKTIGINGDGDTLTLNEKFIKDVCDDKYVFRLQNPDTFDFLVDTNRTYTESSIEKGILENSPPGSRGFIDVAWKDGGAHSIVYEVDENSKITIRDSQTYDEYDLSELASDVWRVSITRTDHLELKEEILSSVQPNDDDKRKYYWDGGYIYYY